MSKSKKFRNNFKSPEDYSRKENLNSQLIIKVLRSTPVRRISKNFTGSMGRDFRRYHKN